MKEQIRVQILRNGEWETVADSEGSGIDVTIVKKRDSAWSLDWKIDEDTDYDDRVALGKRINEALNAYYQSGGRR